MTPDENSVAGDAELLPGDTLLVSPPSPDDDSGPTPTPPASSHSGESAPNSKQGNSIVLMPSGAVVPVPESSGPERPYIPYDDDMPYIDGAGVSSTAAAICALDILCTNTSNTICTSRTAIFPIENAAADDKDEIFALPVHIVVRILVEQRSTSLPPLLHFFSFVFVSTHFSPNLPSIFLSHLKSSSCWISPIWLHPIIFLLPLLLLFLTRPALDDDVPGFSITTFASVPDEATFSTAIKLCNGGRLSSGDDDRESDLRERERERVMCVCVCGGDCVSSEKKMKKCE